MTFDGDDIPIKLSVLAILSIPNSDGSPSKASSDDISDLIPKLRFKKDNLQRYLSRWERQGVLERVNPGARPSQYQLSDKGKEEFRICGRRR